MQPTLLYKKFLCVFMSLMIVFISTQSAYAVTSTGGWTALDTITAGANNTINAAKGAGASAVRSAVAIAPSVANVGKHLLKGGGAAALAFAMIELGDGALDWVLDPANNRIRVNPAAGSDSQDVSCSAKGFFVDAKYGYYATKDAACKAIAKGVGFTYLQVKDGYQCQLKTTAGVTANYNMQSNGTCSASSPDYIQPTAPAPRYIPIDVAASKVIANAAAGHAPSQEAVKAVALEGFAAGEHDAALDAAAVPDTGVENPPDTENPPTDTTKPFDPSSILSALAGISAVLAGILSSLTGFVDWWKAQWTTFSTAITDFNTWVRAEPDTASLQPEPVEVTEGTLVDGWQDKANAGYVNLGSTQCPSDVLIPISYMGASTNLSISYVPFCHFASIIRYAVIMGAWIAALMIISGGRTKE